MFHILFTLNCIHLFINDQYLRKSHELIKTNLNLLGDFVNFQDKFECTYLLFIYPSASRES